MQHAKWMGNELWAGSDNTLCVPPYPLLPPPYSLIHIFIFIFIDVLLTNQTSHSITYTRFIIYERERERERENANKDMPCPKFLILMWECSNFGFVD